jgi:hypothetical protein
MTATSRYDYAVSVRLTAEVRCRRQKLLRGFGLVLAVAGASAHQPGRKYQRGQGCARRTPSGVAKRVSQFTPHATPTGYLHHLLRR